MAGTRKYNDPDETTVKLTVGLPVDLDRQLRALAARLGVAVGPMIREWLVEKLAELSEDQPGNGLSSEDLWRAFFGQGVGR